MLMLLIQGIYFKNHCFGEMLKLARIISFLLGAEKKISFHWVCFSLPFFELKKYMPRSAYHGRYQLFWAGIWGLGL